MDQIVFRIQVHVQDVFDLDLEDLEQVLQLPVTEQVVFGAGQADDFGLKLNLRYKVVPLLNVALRIGQSSVNFARLFEAVVQHDWVLESIWLETSADDPQHSTLLQLKQREYQWLGAVDLLLDKNSSHGANAGTVYKFFVLFAFIDMREELHSRLTLELLDENFIHNDLHGVVLLDHRDRESGGGTVELDAVVHFRTDNLAIARLTQACVGLITSERLEWDECARQHLAFVQSTHSEP